MSWRGAVSCLLLLAARAARALVVPVGFTCPRGHEVHTRIQFSKPALHCQPCAPGRYQPVPSARPCGFCPRNKGTRGHAGATACQPLTGETFCPPGKFGPDFNNCGDCPAGRFGLGGSRTPQCSGLCEVGRYGTGGSKTALCTGRCPAGRFCGEGATSPTDSGLCPKGRYTMDGKGIDKSAAGSGSHLEYNPAALCPLTAPMEFRPRGGYSSSFSEIGACILDKAYRLVELLYALRTCETFRPAVGEVCDSGQADALVDDFDACCAGNEHMVLGKGLRQCQRTVGPLMLKVIQRAKPLIATLATEAKRRAAPRPCEDDAFWKVGDEADACGQLARRLRRDSQTWLHLCTGRESPYAQHCRKTCGVCGGADPSCQDDVEWEATRAAALQVGNGHAVRRLQSASNGNSTGAEVDDDDTVFSPSHAPAPAPAHSVSGFVPITASTASAATAAATKASAMSAAPTATTTSTTIATSPTTFSPPPSTATPRTTTAATASTTTTTTSTHCVCPKADKTTPAVHCRGGVMYRSACQAHCQGARDCFPVQDLTSTMHRSTTRAAEPVAYFRDVLVSPAAAIAETATTAAPPPPATTPSVKATQSCIRKCPTADPMDGHVRCANDVQFSNMCEARCSTARGCYHVYSYSARKPETDPVVGVGNAETLSCARLAKHFHHQTRVPGVSFGQLFCRVGRPTWRHCRVTCGACKPKTKANSATTAAPGTPRTASHAHAQEDGAMLNWPARDIAAAKKRGQMHDWSLFTKTTCTASKVSLHTFGSMKEAKAACAKNKYCGAVLDAGCDQSGRFMLCGVWPALFRPAKTDCVARFTERMLPTERAALAKSQAVQAKMKMQQASGGKQSHSKHTGGGAALTVAQRRWLHIKARAEALVLPVFRLALKTARTFYDLGHHINDDVTLFSNRLLKPDKMTQRSAAALERYLTKWDCDELNCPTPAPTPAAAIAPTPLPTPPPTHFSAADLAPPQWKCPAGKFTRVREITSGPNAGDALYCALCPRGKYQPAVAKAAEPCRACPAGRMSLRRGALVCRAPPAGWSCAAGMFTTLGFEQGALRPVCRMCPPGKHQTRDTLAMQPCRRCPRGKWAPAEGATTCVKRRRGDIACPPGQWGPLRTWLERGKLRFTCKKCPPGRFGLGNSHTSACSGLCAPGRYGTGGSESAQCTGACPAGRFCRQGATGPQDSGACPLGRYFDPTGPPPTATGETGCTLLSPPEYVPAGPAGARSFAFKFGASAACVLDKALRLVELLYALKTCRAQDFTKAPGSLCFTGMVGEITAGFAECCNPPLTRSRKALTPQEKQVCRRQVLKVTKPMQLKLGPIKYHIAHELKQPSGTGDVPQISWARDGKSEEAIILPLFEKALQVAKTLYKYDGNQDLTWASRIFLKLCKLGDCTTLSGVKAVIDRYDCAQIKCDPMTLYKEAGLGGGAPVSDNADTVHSVSVGAHGQ